MRFFGRSSFLVRSFGQKLCQKGTNSLPFHGTFELLDLRTILILTRSSVIVLLSKLSDSQQHQIDHGIVLWHDGFKII
jgi:hypothetical protein